MSKSILELLSEDSLFKVAEEKIDGGKADGHADSEYPKDQIEKGIKVEMEHTDSKAEAKEVAKDHLQEEKEMGKSKDELEYYDELHDMEKELEKDAFELGFQKAAKEYEHNRRFPGRNPRREPLNQPGLSNGGKIPIRQGRGPGRGPETKEAKELTSRGRKQISESNFVFPKERRYPIHDASHARNALARVAQHGTSSEQEAVRKAVREKYPGIGD